MADSLTLTPIGYLKAAKHVKFAALHQPKEAVLERNELELLPGHSFETALRDLEGFNRIWLLSWFHKNNTWRPTVLPPRGPSKRRGVFATRSPHRPNPIALTPVQLISIEGRKLILGPCDLIDGTPVFDIKPYIPEYDSFPEASAGWTGEVSAALLKPAAFTVRFSEKATVQAEWLQANWQIDFRSRLVEMLERDPTPHRTRRIKRIDNQRFSAGCGAWLAIFSSENNVVDVLTLEAGYPLRFLHRPGDGVPEREAQLAFLERWPSERPG